MRELKNTSWNNNTDKAAKRMCFGRRRMLAVASSLFSFSFLYVCLGEEDTQKQKKNTRSKNLHCKLSAFGGARSLSYTQTPSDPNAGYLRGQKFPFQRNRKTIYDLLWTVSNGKEASGKTIFPLPVESVGVCGKQSTDGTLHPVPGQHIYLLLVASVRVYTSALALVSNRRDRIFTLQCW